jgi:YD repeat-containing protein
VIGSADGSEVFVFDAKGRHLETRNSLSGATTRTFAYDTEGRLIHITDFDGNVMIIERDAIGEPTAITGPFGARTLLTLDADGFLSSVTNPAGESTSLVHGPNGLLDEFERPNGAVSSFDYDGGGRLILDEDPAGGFKTLARETDGNGFVVTLGTAEGIVETKRLEFRPDGGEQRLNTDAAGLATEVQIEPDGSRTTVAPNGTVVQRTLGPDPRFGFQSPIAASAEVTTPGGLTFSRSHNRAATLDPTTGTLLNQTDTITRNGRVSTWTFDVVTSEITTETPEGRLITETVDAMGRITRLEENGLLPIDLFYDAAGRLDEIVQGTGAEERRTSFAYDSDGFLAQVTDPLLRTVDLVYDAAGRVTSQTLPGGRYVGLGYDVNGNVTSLTPPGQREHIFRYTPIDREAEYEPPSVAGVSEPRTFFD